ncbi:DivIVA domain-containing protein [Arthrobacter subterraneus]|uniref:DivIVA domain-containing protein n=1 Tax=Arthrobacter subterraneus TaxID=335973 RepID=A0A1G8C1W3_9MICC|nr:DivIVA domain-containing protein [Arthrobacter subterraneus]SDH39364.1 DivIVA domain-containing protein [Arthrobacter subterraneus]
MTTFLVLVAIMAVGATAFLAVGRSRQDVESGQRGEPADVPGLVEPTPTLPPVLLPERPDAADVRRVRFSLGLRGYRMDQVDEVLDRLAAALAERDALIEGLQNQLQAWDGDQARDRDQAGDREQRGDTR